jgi:hypothetical protein
MAYGDTRRGVDYAGGTQNVGATAGSYGVNSPFGSPVPDLSQANPETLGRLNINNLVYSVSVGGYLTQPEASNANSWYNKFGAGSGGDPTANARAAAYYNYLGTLPTRPVGTPALNQFYSQFGGQPASGPSLNSTLSNQFNNSSPYMQGQLREAGFGPSYTGPWQFGQRNPNYNQYGVYTGVGGGGGPMTGTAW